MALTIYDSDGLPLSTTVGTDSDAIHDNVGSEITALTEKVSPAGTDVILIEDTAASNVKKKVQITNLPAGGETNNLESDGMGGCLDDEIPIGSGVDTAAYQALPNGAVSYATATNTLSQAALANLSDVTGTTGTGSTVVFNGSPTITTPTIASFANATHNHQAAAGGGTLSHNSATDNPSSGTHGVTGSVVGTTDTQTLSAKTLTSPTLGTQVTLDQTTADYTLTWANPAAARAISITDPGGSDSFAWLAATQTLTNKTIDANNNTVSNLAHGAEVDNPSSGVHGVTGSVVGTTDTQTLSAKTLTSPTLGTQVTLDQTTGDYTLTWADPATARAISITDPGGSDSFVWLAATQTLSNKSLSQPTIGDFTLAGHNHENLTGGSTLASAATPSAIHDDTTGEINALTDKASPVGADIIIIEDSAASFAKKKVSITNLPAGGESNALETDGMSGCLDNEVPVGTGADTATYIAIPTSQALAFDGSGFTNATWNEIASVAADVTIDLTGATTRTLTIQNSTASQVCSIDVDGSLFFRNNSAFTMRLTGSPTANRVLTFQDSDDTIVGRATTDTLTNKTLTQPVIGDFTNATHSHQNNAGGGTLTHNSATDNPSSGTHGVTGSVVGTTDTQTLTNKDIADSTNKYRRKWAGSLPSPSASENRGLFYCDVAMTISQVTAVLVGTSPSVTYQIVHSTDRSDATPNALTTSGTVTSTTTGTNATLSDNTVPASSWVWLVTTASSNADEIDLYTEMTED